MFDRVGMQTNVGKKVGIVYHPCQAAGTQWEAAYKRRMTGEGITYRERQRARVKCSDCGEEMAMGSLEVYRKNKHGREAGGRRKWDTSKPEG